MATMEQVRKKVAMERQRIALDLSPMVAAHLDRVSDALGVPKSQVVIQTLVQALPELLARVAELEAAERQQSKKK